jgi:hypothetical protein
MLVLSYFILYYRAFYDFAITSEEYSGVHIERKIFN